MGLLSECIGARGFDAATYFESAIRDVQLIPGLEGSTHINYGLSVQFMQNYFSGSDHDLPMPASVMLLAVDAGENSYWMRATERNAGAVRFAPCLQPYEQLGLGENVTLFRAQVETFRCLAAKGILTLNPTNDVGLTIAIGRCLSIVVYGQLVAENCRLAGAAPAIVSVIFHGLVEDLSTESLRLSAMLGAGGTQETLIRGVVQVPRTSAADVAATFDLLMARYGTQS